MRTEQPIHCGEGVGVIAVTLRLRDTSLAIYSIYNPPAATLNLGELFPSADIQPTFIAGDFSCHHPILYSIRTNTAGRHLGAILSLYPEISLLNDGKPTHIQGGVLDLAFTSAQLKHRTKFSIHPTLTGDHHATLSQLCLPTLPPPAPPPPKYNTKKADWHKFNKCLETSNSTHNLPVELNDHETHVTNAFQAAAAQSIPLTSRPQRTYSDYWFYDERVAEVNRRINAARKCHRRNPTPDNRAILTDVLRHASQIKAGVREEKWTEWCRSIDATTSLTNIWRNIRRVQGKGTGRKSTHHDSVGEADCLGDTFAHHTHTTNLPPEMITKLEELSLE